MARRTLPWEQIKHDYVFGIEKDGQRIYPSWRDIIEKYGISSQTLSRRIKAENWNELRKKNQMEIEAKSHQKAIENISNKLAEVNTQGVDGALEMMQSARLALRGCLQAYKEGEKLPMPVQERAEFIRGLSAAMRALQQMHKGGLEAARLALGEPTEITEDIVTFERIMQEAREYIESQKVDDGDPSTVQALSGQAAS